MSARRDFPRRRERVPKRYAGQNDRRVLAGFKSNRHNPRSRPPRPIVRRVLCLYRLPVERDAVDDVKQDGFSFQRRILVRNDDLDALPVNLAHNVARNRRARRIPALAVALTAINRDRLIDGQVRRQVYNRRLPRWKDRRVEQYHVSVLRRRNRGAKRPGSGIVR